MKVVDLNVLVYATDSTSARHAVAKTWLDAAISSSDTIGLPTAVTIGFVRITTNARIMQAPLKVSESVAIVRGWLQRANVSTPAPTDRHYEIMEEILSPLPAGGNIVSDAHLAAIAIAHGAEVYSFDRDFGRFAGLRWAEPT